MGKIWRIANYLYNKRWKLGRLFEVINFIINSNSISAKAIIGKTTVFHHHGLGCVIHDNTEIGENCHIFQNVTIGSKWPKGKCEGNCPKIGNNVFIGAGAVILGNISIGDNAIIGANSVVLESVRENVMMAGVPAVIKKENYETN